MATMLADIPVAAVRLGAWQSARIDSAEISKLAKSIAKDGLLELILVAPTSEIGQYQLVLGHRRYQAAVTLGWSAIKAGVLDRLIDEVAARTISAIESAQSRVHPEELEQLSLTAKDEFGLLS